MFKVAIYDTYQEGIIVPLPTKVVWTNQVGGTACSHPEVEGIFIPILFNAVSHFNDYMRRTSEVYTTEMVARINAFLVECDLKDCFEAVPVDELNKEVFDCIAEAWIPVKVLAYAKRELLLPFKGMTVVLTYRNSD